MDIANFKEQSVNGTSYIRCSQIVIGNNLGSKPWVSFTEQKVINLSQDNQIVQPHRTIGISVAPESYSTSFAILDPVTGLDTGATMTYEQLFAIMYSLYVSISNQEE